MMDSLDKIQRVFDLNFGFFISVLRPWGTALFYDQPSVHRWYTRRL